MNFKIVKWFVLLVTMLFILYSVFIAPSVFVIGGKEIIFPNSQSIIDKNLTEKLIHDANTVVDYCRTHYYPDSDRANFLVRNWNKIRIRQLLDSKESVAYVIDKNKELRFCFDVNEENAMRFVLLHELAHMMSKNYGHGSEFVTNFYDLLRLGTHLNIYIPINYSEHNVRYCDYDITVSPLFPKVLT